MLLLAAVVVGLVVGLLSGGKLGNLAHITFRWPWFVLVALLIREAVVYTPLSRIEGVQYVYAAALAALIAWALLHVDRLPGVWVVAAGAAMNLVVVLANGARMPVASSAAGSLLQRGHAGQYVVMGSGTNLNWLADWMVVPGPLGGVYSPGDVVVAFGIAIVACFATRHRPAPTTKLDETTGRIGSYPP